MNKRFIAAIAVIALPSLAAPARKLPGFDALETSAPRAARATPAAQAGTIAGLARPGAPVHLDERLGVPQFLWASKEASAAALSALRGGAASFSASGMEPPEEAARAHLANFAPAYGLSGADLETAVVAQVHDIGRGPVIVQLEQRVDGIEVFRERVRVIMDRNHELIALSGHISGTGAESFALQSSFQLGAADAVASAFSDLSGVLVDAGAMRSSGALDGGYEAIELTAGLKRTLAGAPTQPARAKPVWFHGVDGLQPAYYVEVDSGDSNLYAYVISAADGSILFRNDLTADAGNSFTYRVWAADPADPANPSAPFDGPQGNGLDPHPSGTPDGTQPAGPVPQADVTLVSSPYVADPWLPIGALETTGNNADAYADLVTPDGFSPGTVDFRAGITAPGAFQYTYDAAHPNTPDSMKAALVQMFYNVNFFHDWYYRSGFTEAAGNAQANNYGRGGVAGDSIRAEGQDFSGRNNANMNTPADGGRPRMQMFLFDGIAARHLFVTAGSGLGADYATGVPSGWGISSHDVTGDLVWVTDGVGSTTYPPATTTTTTVHDGCDYTAGPGGAVDPNWANVTGKIAFIDRGGTPPAGVATCGFSDKAFNAQKAGAIGVIIASTTPHGAPAPINMAAATTPPPVVTIPVYQMSTPDGDAFRAAFAQGTVTVRMQRDVAVDQDGTVDNQIMAHEWGHYISNRLVQNSSGLTTNMSRGMGEGWADFHALLLTVKEEDASVPSNLAYGGVYGLAVWVSTGGTNGPLANQGAYFGIRRMPYSTDKTKNNMTYKNIQDSSAIPVGVPFLFWPAPGTTAANGGNSEVHNTGEVWATMLWECYASMLRRTVGANADLTFSQARERMKDILVAAYKATPPQPTFLEARDAVLAAAYATDMTDYRNFIVAFAKRGAGLDAVSPDRYSGTNNGVVEGSSIGNDMSFVGAAVADDVASCDRDNVLDSGETGHLNITLRNDSSQVLTQTTATLSSANPNITFPSGNTITFGSTNPRETVTAGVVIAMASGLTGAQPFDVSITYGDPALIVPTSTVTWSANGNIDDLTAQAQVDGFESNTLAWTTLNAGGTAAQGWTRNTISPVDHNMRVADQNTVTDLSLVSPVLVAGNPLTLSFQHRFGFEFSGTTFFDGGVVEITADNGATWTDIGSLAASPGQRYNGTLAAGTNPLGPRAAFVGNSPGYPAYVTTTINLGSTYAGKQVKVRFRAGSDSNGVASGWEIDNVSFTGIGNRPFPALLPNKCAAGVANRRPSAPALVSGTLTRPERTSVTYTFSATDADNDPLQFLFVQTAGTPVTFTVTAIDSTHASVSFVTPEVPPGNGSVQFTVQAFDGTAYGSTGVATVTVTNVDRPPVANAGPAQAGVPERTLVTLNGNGSSDPDGDALTFQWTQTAGPPVTLSSAAAASPTFVAPEVTREGATLTFSLTVTALGVTSPASTVNVGVVDVNRPPSISAGAPQAVDERTLVQLHGSGTDPDLDALSWSWTQLSPASPVVSLAGTSEPAFTAPEVTADTDFVFQATASDGLASAQATVTVTVRNVNLAPVAIAHAAAAFANERSSVALDGSGSFDPDSSALLSYRWTVDPGTPLPGGATLTNATQALATFNTGDVTADTPVTFHLVVNDGTLESAPATVTVTVLQVNRAPIAVITGPSGAFARSTVTLSGLSSHDPDGDALHYHWVQTAGPAAALIGADTAAMSFVAPEVKTSATLGFQLQVDDGSLISAPASATVIVQKFRGKHEDELTMSTAQVSGGCTSAGASSFAPLLLLLAFGLRRRRRTPA